MSYNHLTIKDRIRIEVFSLFGFSTRFIAKILGRHHSTIARELSRNKSKGFYHAETAQSLYAKRRMSNFPKGKFSDAIARIISDKISEKWSPEQIVHTVLNETISFKTIYKWIYQGKIPNVSEKDLRHKGKRKKKETRGKFTVGTSIKNRPKEVKKREEFGHWELDTMVSSRGKSKGCLATFVERKTRFYTAIKIKDRTKDSMLKAIKQLVAQMPKQATKTFTTDRGKEFACYIQVEKDFKIPVYFADPYAAWQRGSNENSNGLLREYYPKKTDLAKVDEEELGENLLQLNKRPRKCLEWKSPYELFLEELSHLP